MKNMSFGKLVAIFITGFVVLIGGTIFIIKMVNKSKQATTVVVTQKPQPVIAAPSAEIAAKAAATQEAQEALITSIKQEIHNGNAVVTQRIDQVSINVAALDQRLSAIEAKGKGKEKPTEMVVKPIRKKVANTVQPHSPSAKLLGKASGYEVDAVVSNRVWVTTGTTSDSVTVGEALPTPSKSPKILAIEPGLIVLSTSN
jgi:hypothetical protein